MVGKRWICRPGISVGSGLPQFLCHLLDHRLAALVDLREVDSQKTTRVSGEGELITTQEGLVIYDEIQQRLENFHK
jgi:hypothetical protein